LEGGDVNSGTSLFSQLIDYLPNQFGEERKLNLYTMLQILHVSLFEKIPINQGFSPNESLANQIEIPKQLQQLDF